MNDDDQRREHDRRHAEPDRKTPPRGEPDAAETGTPEAVKKAAEARQAKKARLEQVRGRGVDWVRPTDLLVQSSGKLAGRGIYFNAEQGRRLRKPLITGARAVSERAKRLPPVTAFGRRGATQDGPVRSGVGMR